MVHARRTGRVRNVHVVIHHVHQHLQHGSDNATAARAACRKVRLATLKNHTLAVSTTNADTTLADRVKYCLTLCTGHLFGN